MKKAQSRSLYRYDWSKWSRNAWNSLVKNVRKKKKHGVPQRILFRKLFYLLSIEKFAFKTSVTLRA
jgi:hypothetical protein